MEAGSDGDTNKGAEGSKRPKRQMKTPFQLETLERTYSTEMYPSEATRAELSEKLGLTDRQLQMWFCHRRLKDKKDKEAADKKETVGVAPLKPRNPGSTLRKATEPVGGNGSDSGSASASDSESSEFNDEDDTPAMYYESPRTIMGRRVIACVEAQLGESLREDGPILGIEFDELPPGAFGSPIVPRELQDRYRHPSDSKLYGQFDARHIKAASSGPQEGGESKIRTDEYGHVASSYMYDSPNGPTPKGLPHARFNGHLSRGRVEGQVSTMDIYSQPSREMQFSSSPRSAEFITPNNNIPLEKKRKSDEVRTGSEKKIRKELEKQDILRRKREEQMRKEMERQYRERQKEEQRLMREQQKQEEKNQREEKREMERREKFMQKELLRAERMKHKEDLRREREAARQRAAMERATARRIAKESMDLIEDERLELMELAASSKGLPSILSLDYDTLQNLESFRDALCEFPPKSVQLRMPFSIQPWMESEENIGNLMMVWKFCATFADVLMLWPFTIDEFIQAFHDYDSRLLGEIHIAILKLIIKDIEDIVRTPSGGPGTNQYSAVNPEGGHPHIVEGAYMWGFDVRNWQKLLNPLTWPEIFRQLALSAGFGPQLKKKSIDRVPSNDTSESKGCEEIVSTLRNGSAVINAVAVMQEKGLTHQRKSRHRLTPGTVKFAAYHILALEGSKGLNVIELAEKIQKSGIRDLKTSKTPEASISVALSRDPILFERIAPSTYCVRPAFRKDPADAESIIASAKDKIQRYTNGFLADQNADEEERDDESDSDVPEGTEVVDLATPMIYTNKNGECNGFGSSKSKDKLPERALQNETNSVDIAEGYPNQGVEIDDSISGEPWVQGLTEGEYSDLPVEDRLNALVALIGVANEGNSIRVILEERMDAANSLKKQMWAEAQLDKRRMREEIITKIYDSSFNDAGECGLNPMVLGENKIYDPSGTMVVQNESSAVAEDINNSIGQFVPTDQQNEQSSERSRLQLKSYIGHRAEELYAYRSLPLGQDRRRNRYWQFVATASCLDPGAGRIFVESPDVYWRLIDTEEAFDALLMSLDTRGTRESHLHIMLQKIEVHFKECVQKNRSIDKSGQETGFPSSAISDALDPPTSFRIEVGRNKDEMNNQLKRYEDLQTWIWKECFNSSIVRAMAHGKSRCSPLLGICEFCLATYDSKDMCPSCHRTNSKVVARESFLEQFNGTDLITLNTSPPRIRLIKAILSSIEVSVPSEGLDPSWTEDLRKTWGLELQKLLSPEGLLQFVTQLEGGLKRDYVSEDFETSEELLRSDTSNYLGTTVVAQLPWIPMTTAAVALRLLELDASIFYTLNQKVESIDQKKAQVVPMFGQKSEAAAMCLDQLGYIKKENPGQFCDEKINRGRGGRPRGKAQKGKQSNSKKQGKTLGVRLPVQKQGRGRKNNNATLQEKVSFMNVVEEEPRGRNAVVESVNDNSMEGGVDSDDNDVGGNYEEWGNEMEMSEEENYEMDDENGVMGFESDDDDDGDVEGNVDEGSEFGEGEGSDEYSD